MTYVHEVVEPSVTVDENVCVFKAVDVLKELEAGVKDEGASGAVLSMDIEVKDLVYIAFEEFLQSHETL